MNNSVNATNSLFCGGNDNMLLILVLLLILAPGFMCNLGNDPLLLIVLAIIFLPSLGLCGRNVCC